MRVLVGPRVDLEDDPFALEVARSLAGDDGGVLCLREAGVRNLARPLSAAEVGLLRKAMGAATETAVIGYVCLGKDLGEATVPRTVVAVADHANLVWRSPLVGANDDSVGPRFPSATGIYDPGRAEERLRTAEGMIVVSGVVAGVRDDERLNAFETETTAGRRFSAVSSELVPVAIIAAHMGILVAAVVIIAGS